MKEIELTQGQVVLVDDEWFEYLSQWKWQARYSPHTESFYAVRMSSIIKGKRFLIHMHRVISKVPDGLFVDHINHDTLNNLSENLRICTRSQNQQNRKIHKNNTSGYKGVSKTGNKWRTLLYQDGKRVYSETFLSKEDAARAYDKEAKSRFGKFAVLNFPESLTSA